MAVANLLAAAAKLLILCASSVREALRVSLLLAKFSADCSNDAPRPRLPILLLLLAVGFGVSSSVRKTNNYKFTFIYAVETDKN